MTRSTWYGIMGAAVILLDRITKWWALHYWVHEKALNDYLSFQVTLNRGISWGMLSYGDTTLFTAVSLIIVLVTVLLGYYAYQRYQQGYFIGGEVLVISGSLSNIIDRVIYNGVVDFIIVHKGELTWPVFNIADSFIVLGVFIMFLEQYFSREKAA